MLGWVWQWLIRVYQGQGSETNPLWTLVIKGCIVYREFNNNIKTNWKVHLLFFYFYHLAPATLNNMSNKIFIPSGETTPTSLLLGMVLMSGEPVRRYHRSILTMGWRKENKSQRKKMRLTPKQSFAPQ